MKPRIRLRIIDNCGTFMWGVTIYRRHEISRTMNGFTSSREAVRWAAEHL